jgi:sirohydrochlorin ferrochelatase
LYTNGTPDRFIGDIDVVVDNDEKNQHPHQKLQQAKRGRVIGILLMDHGSRNQASNERLHELAALYQKEQQQQSSSNYLVNSNSNSDDDDDVTVIVQAAHMEIATPSVPQGLQQLLAQNVDLIICHPFFLSPAGRHAGRHVAEDIPRIIEQAIQDLNMDVNKIPIVTTAALGAQTHVMLNAIHSSIQQATSNKRLPSVFNIENVV